MTMETLKSCPFEEPIGKYKIEIDKQQTNEEWFCGLSTEEKVAALVDLHKKVRRKMRTEIGGENSLSNGDYHRQWLKEEPNE